MDMETLHVKVEQGLQEGKSAGEICRKYKVSQAGYSRWKRKNGLIKGRPRGKKPSGKPSKGKFVEFTSALDRGVELRLKDGTVVTAHTKEQLKWLLELCQ